MCFTRGQAAAPESGKAVRESPVCLPGSLFPRISHCSVEELLLSESPPATSWFLV